MKGYAFFPMGDESKFRAWHPLTSSTSTVKAEIVRGRGSGFRRISADFGGFRRISADFGGFRRISADFGGFRWISADVGGNARADEITDWEEATQVTLGAA